MEEMLSKIGNLRLDCLDDAWAEAVYYNEFLEFGEMPPEFVAVLKKTKIKIVFRNIMTSIDEWLKPETECEEEKSWAALAHQVPHQKLLAILGYYIDYGTKNVIREDDRNKALLASRVYYKLLAIPGYKAYNIYHSQLFAHSLACLGFPKNLCDKYYKDKECKSNDEDRISDIAELKEQANSVIKQLQKFVADLKAIVEQLQLGPSDMNYEDILSNLVDVTGGAIVNKLDIDKLEFAQICGIIYEVIDVLIYDSNKEPDPGAILILYKCLLPKLIAACVDSKSANNLVRASYVTYLALILSKYGKTAISGYRVLLEHLCFSPDGLERAEARTARVNMVAGLMSLLPAKSHNKAVLWLIKLSTSGKVVHRQIATELLSKLLSNEPELNEEIPPEDNMGEQTPSKENSTAETGAENPQADNQPPNNAEPSEGGGEEKEQQKPPEKEKEPEPEVIEEDVTSLIHQRPHTVPYFKILRAVYERFHDQSGTVRSRALGILAECLSSERPPMKQAIMELQGSGEVSRLMAAGARGVCDERAVVRRAALALVHRLLSGRYAPPPAANDLGILVSLCRDASVIVRSAAIAALADMVTTRPGEVVFDAFLSGPMHQLSDPENKVQDQVKTLVQDLLINRLKKYSISDEDPLPWMFLAGITRHNMKRHLQKACALLAKDTNCISVRLMDSVSTHLGALGEARDLQCLVMLTSAARHVDYSDLGFVLDYYYKLCDSPDLQEKDSRLLPLTLELLSVWSRFARTDDRTMLRDHLVRRLAAAGNDGSRIASATLAAQLDPTNLTWATELMQLAERRALDGGAVEEWVRAADLSLVAPVPPSPALLQLFLSALPEPPPDWCARRAGECVAGVGRLCVRSRGAAGAAAPALAALLHSAACLPARVNALLVLTDICTRYTCIVEPLLGSVCGCLEARAPAELRRAAVRALTRLLLAGFLRLRTPLYYKYCALLADEDHDVREPAEYYVTCCLTTDAIYHHFVDCVLHYNNDYANNMSFDARQLIYDVMLQRLSLVQKLNVQCRLAREILEHAADIVDEGEELPQAMNAALLDTTTLLCGPRMRLPKKQPASGDAADIDDLQERVTTNIVSQKMKHTVAEVLVPAVLRLHARLRGGGGQLVAYLVRLATDLLNDYRTEIEDIIETDEDLVETIQQFQETIGMEPSNGNLRNLVTSSAPPEPETPRAPRRRPAARSAKEPRHKRALRI